MSIKLDAERCGGCGNSPEPPCVRICPGDLIHRGDNGKAELCDESDCWDCGACVKACPRQALGISLPIAAGGNGSILKARRRGSMTEWILTHPDGRVEEFALQAMCIV